ncbi:MAG: coenzyme F420-0:L-glutamate ligase [Lachnospiraceae bacterium]|nr:coenzyme F420-0:L-glutamate ligase [Lachnospiraceae bacterium]
MARLVGTVSRGIRTPIIREGDDIVSVVTSSVLSAAEDPDWGFRFRDRDILCMTEAIVARAQGNYVSVDDIAKDVKAKTGGGTVGVVFPILSRNRFAICLRGIAMGVSKVVLQLSYPADEVGNHLIEEEIMDTVDVDPYRDVLDVPRYRELFGYHVHRFTGVDYVDYYQKLVEEAGAECEIIFANDPREVLKHTKTVLACDIHTAPRTKRLLREAGADCVLGLDEIMNAPVDGSGYNETYGLLGSNKATEDTVKLFPRDAQGTVLEIQKLMYEKTGKKIEVMVYGDGGFKDPAGGIWEFADPVVAPFFTEGLRGTPNELKIKFLADNDFSQLEGEALKEAIKNEIEKKDADLVGKMASEGTTPRQLTDLIGSLSDLTSGSGDKGTPVVYIQGYFDNYSTE